MGIRVFFLLLFTFQYSYADLECPSKVVFADELIVKENKKTKSVFLNGVGLKKFLFFNIFYGALYLENPTSDPDDIMDSSELKIITIHALRDVSEEQLADEWDKEYERLCADRCEKLRKYHEQFLSYAREVKTHERISLIFFPDRLEFISNTGEKFLPIKSPEYGEIMLMSSIGPDPGDSNLKKGMLGLDSKLCKEI